MREIKFRVFAHERDDEGCVGFLENDEFSHTYYDGGWRSLQYFIRFPAFTLQQYTGLKDKKGKEIYEGDIVNFILPNNKIEVGACWPYRGKSLVEWSDKSGNYIINFKDCYNTITANLFSCTSIEVIGNIFETPELIKA